MEILIAAVVVALGITAGLIAGAHLLARPRAGAGHGPGAERRDRGAAAGAHSR